MLLTAPYFADVAKMPDSRIANALRPLEAAGFDRTARAYAIETDQPPGRAAATLIANACALPAESAA